jgi:membrane fusion protein, copper/silver efflux system
VQADPTRVAKVNVKVAGYVEKVFADFAGQPVRKGDPLFTFYSPDLVAAQQEFLLAAKPSSGALSATDSVVLAAVKRKLELWDVSGADMTRLEQTGEVLRALTMVSPVSGVITAKNVVEGSSLMPGEAAYEITDLNSVWVMADAYQSDASKVHVGMPAQITMTSLPQLLINGKVAFIDPQLDPETRTFKLRINVDNDRGELKPEMFVDVRLESTVHQTLVMPFDAVIPTGQGAFVFVAKGDGKFEPRAVVLGQKAGNRVEIVSGLSEGESVVSRANFLVDSESSLRASLSAIGGQ